MVTRRQAVLAGILAVAVLAAAVALLITSGHDHRPPHLPPGVDKSPGQRPAQSPSRIV